MADRPLRAAYCGRLDYRTAIALQERLRDEILARATGESADALLLLEHPHVFTLGRNADPAHVRATGEWLRRLGVAVEQADRGGQVTYHGPGQLVGYPILSLSPDRRDLRRYVRDLQEVLVRTLADLGIAARGGEGTPAIGVWVDRGTVLGPGQKIASIGVHVRRWVTTHGFALNASTDLELYDGIVACGMPDIAMTSIARCLGGAPPLPELAERCARHLAAVFDRSLRWCDPVELGLAPAPAGEIAGGVAIR